MLKIFLRKPGLAAKRMIKSARKTFPVDETGSESCELRQFKNLRISRDPWRKQLLAVKIRPAFKRLRRLESGLDGNIKNFRTGIGHKNIYAGDHRIGVVVNHLSRELHGCFHLVNRFRRKSNHKIIK